MKKKALAGFMAAAMAVSMAACGAPQAVNDDSDNQKTEQKEENKAQDSGEEAEKSTGGKITLTLICHQSRSNIGEGGFTTGFFGALDAWQEEHPDVEVKVEEMDQTAYQTKINSLGASGDMPDLFMMKGSWTKTFVENGWVSDITAELDADQEWKNAYIKGGFDAATRDGKNYGVPQESMSTGMVYYNSDMWKEIGYETFPETWDELLDAVDKFKEKGITPFVMGNKPNWPAESCWLSTLGDRFTGPEWTQSILDGSGAKFTDEPFVKALTAFQELAQRGAFNEDINSIDDTEQNTVYFNKKAAAIVNGTWFIPTIDNSAPEDVKAATKLAILPSVEGGAEDQKTVSGGPAWFMALSSKVTDPAKRELAMDLLKALTDERQANVTASMGGVTAWADPEYDTAKVPALFNEYNDMIKDITAVQIYDACMDASVIETMNVGLQSLLIGEKAPEELAEEIQMEQELAQ